MKAGLKAPDQIVIPSIARDLVRPFRGVAEDALL
jgi:hypothetical protein